MSRAKIAKKSTAIDMTPMVDLAFLLITFFMLTIKFRPVETVQISIPSSIAEQPLPGQDVMVISVDTGGRVFLSVDRKQTRYELIKRIAKHYNLDITDQEAEKFSLMTDIGVPVGNLKQWINLSADDQKKNARGIPCDSTNNQLKELIKMARYANFEKFEKDLRIAIKADVKTPYPAVKKVIETLRNEKINRFNLITNKEAKPTI
jgi:biopolymer transport protein ExbD